MSASFVRGSLGCCSFVFVENRPFLVRVMWPFVVAIEDGRCRLMSAADMTGNVSSSGEWCQSTCSIVDVGGHPRD